MRPFDPSAGTAGSLRLMRVVLAASVLVPILLFAGIFWHDRVEVEAEAEHRVRRTTLVLHEHALKIFETVEQVLGRIEEHAAGKSWEEIGRSEDLHLHMRDITRQLPQFASIGLISPDGRVVASSRVFPFEPADVSDREYFRVQRDRDAGMLVTPPIRGRVTGLPQFNVSRRRSTTPAADSGGKDGGPFDGLMIGALYTNYFTDFYERITSQDEDAVAIVRSDGVMLVRSPATRFDESARMEPASALMQAIAIDPEEGLFRSRGTRDGIPRLSGYKRLGPYPVYMVYGISEAAITGAWLHHMLFDLVFGAPATLALVLTSWLALRRSRRETEALQRWTTELSAREKLEDALRQSQKMEALGQLTGGVAHDFNNLLTAAQTNLHLASRGIAAGNERYLEGARTALERAGKLTRQLLAFSRQEAVSVQTLDVAEALRKMGDLLERSIRADITLRWNIAPVPMRVKVDPVQFELAILNLALNGRDAMPRGGTLLITARPEAAEAQLMPRHVMIEVTDTGTGMPPEVQARAFEPFFTTKSAGKGTGLGLSMVYGFARQSGGTAEIESKAGEGTMIRLILPATGEQPATAPTPVAVDLPTETKLRVLLVEDNALVLMSLVDGLAEEGLDILTAENGETALATLKQRGPVDVLVSDVVMPGLSGIELARRVRREWPGTRVLLISGYSPESLAGMGADTVDAVLPKPFTPDQLAIRIRTLLRPEANRP